MTTTGEILVVRLGGLGDVLVSLPSLAYLRRCYQGRSFTLICREDVGLLLREAGLAENIWSPDASFLSGLFGESGEDSILLSRLGRFEAAWGWMTGKRGAELRRSLARAGIPTVRIIDPPDGHCRIPIHEFYLQETVSAAGARRSRLAGIKQDTDLFRLRFPDAESGSREAVPSAFIHPGSGGRRKCWPLERFLEIARRLAEEGWKGRLITGEAEDWLEPELASRPLPDRWSWMRRPPLVPLAKTFGRGGLYLGNDSGITHLAAACGLRGLAVFKAENIPLWTPFGRIEILGASDRFSIRTEDVWNKIRHDRP